MKKYELHEFAKIYPLISDNGLQDLAEDINENGLREPITIWNGQIIDGRHRYLACEIAEIEPTFIEFNGSELDALRYVASKNSYRRNLTSKQKALAATKIFEKETEILKETITDKNTLNYKLNILKRKIAKQHNTRTQKIDDVLELQETPRLLEKVDVNRFSLEAAVNKKRGHSKPRKATLTQVNERLERDIENLRLDNQYLREIIVLYENEYPDLKDLKNKRKEEIREIEDDDDHLFFVSNIKQ